MLLLVRFVAPLLVETNKKVFGSTSGKDFWRCLYELENVSDSIHVFPSRQKPIEKTRLKSFGHYFYLKRAIHFSRLVTYSVDELFGMNIARNKLAMFKETN
jgi:hypothetical protein